MHVQRHSNSITVYSHTAPSFNLKAPPNINFTWYVHSSTLNLLTRIILTCMHEAPSIELMSMSLNYFWEPPKVIRGYRTGQTAPVAVLPILNIRVLDLHWLLAWSLWWRKAEPTSTHRRTVPLLAVLQIVQTQFPQQNRDSVAGCFWLSLAASPSLWHAAVPAKNNVPK